MSRWKFWQGGAILLAVGSLALAGCGGGASADGSTADGQVSDAGAASPGSVEGSVGAPGQDPAAPGGESAAGTPGAPKDVRAVAGAASLTASWTAPDGSAPITEYRAFAFDAEELPTAQCTAASPANTCEMTDLPAGKYTVSVRAVNASGAGPASKASATAEVK